MIRSEKTHHFVKFDFQYSVLKLGNPYIQLARYNFKSLKVHNHNCVFSDNMTIRILTIINFYYYCIQFSFTTSVYYTHQNYNMSFFFWVSSKSHFKEHETSFLFHVRTNQDDNNIYQESTSRITQACLFSIACT